ncbi:hypothetical protein Kpol_541p4 [Vanderwaltozyma polyspora DSM 70294]|uniref:Histone deacetylase complex subunit SAP30 Sin3 binding domain-containing protein n=1 Tax=Vanderwaltozyma polyspora (strain ATCC 22028 / DSM 70294 / BCRC 21397 / CBS 2163 / NBRC 10782 / NRRL Y-8283 / UCD 57-17) TaxID=436907 RepID=A7TIU9_VANPO|nr:uncharacterized protein Kpol_541p4 [Vanderwaltozyma polyspora DSM 70294]EDO17761.1 hypothetical protein Kpol_541p4 [Vanderwaltozyma polyspora DSM 70294]
MARTTASNSESEAKTSKSTNTGSSYGGQSNSGARNTAKQRLTAAQSQYIKNLVKTHITNNHPGLKSRPHPLDFEMYSDDILRRYKDHFKLGTEDNLTLDGYMLGSQLGSRTYSGELNKVGKPEARVLKKDLADEVKKHFLSYGIKETVCIPHFIYKVKTQKKKFKMEFND